MKKPVVFIAKLALFFTVAVFIAWNVWKYWDDIEASHLTVAWGYLPVAMLGYVGVVLTSASVWRFLAWRMGDRNATLPLLGAYTFSQMGKYVWKGILLLMRIERSGRVGMSLGMCTISTLLENVLYMISGGMAGLLAVVAHTKELREAGYGWVLPASIGAIVVLIAVCHPVIFYGVVNVALRRLKQEEVTKEKRLGMGTLCLALVMFMPCWIFGGLALWASARCVTPTLPLEGSIVLMGAFALSVIGGMLGLLPAGFGIREGILMIFLTWELDPTKTGKMAGAVLAAVGLQRLAQILTETAMGLVGGALTSVRKPANAAVDLTRS